MVDGIRGLLGDPGFNEGIGLLAGAFGRPASVTDAIRPGLALGQAATRNQTQREKILAAQRRRKALEQLPGLLGSTDPIDRTKLLGLLADVAPDPFVTGLLGQAFPKPQGQTSFRRDFEFLRGLGISQEDALKSLRRGTTVNVGKDPLNKPMSTADLTRTLLPDGTRPPIGTTPRQAAAAGAIVATPAQQKALDASDKFKPILDRIETLALGPADPATGRRSGGVFSDVQPGFGNRVKSGLDLFIASLTRENPNVSELESLTLGTLSPIIRQLGEAGALSDGDVNRAIGLLPQIRDNFLLPDTREDAVRKLNTLRLILERGEKKLRGQTSRQSKPRNRRLKFDAQGNPVR